jgi:hypothetical protein
VCLPSARGEFETYEGAIVLDPVPGFYTAPVGVADFASLYPSTIISENISHDTLVWVKDYNEAGNLIRVISGADTYVWSPATGLSATTGSTVSANPTVTTTYTVIGTGANGCQSSDTVTVTVNNPVVIISQSPEQGVLPGQTATISVTATGTVSGYQWMMSDDEGATFVALEADEIFEGVTSNTLSINNVDFDFAGLQFQCMVLGTTPCGDGTTQRTIYIHQSSVITTGTTGLGDYYLEMTMPTISANTTFTSCEVGCTNSVNGVVSTVNSSSTGTTGNYTGTTTVGSLYDNSFKFMYRVNVSTVPRSGATQQNQISISNFQNETYPSTGTTETGYTIVPSYSAVTCPNILNTFSSSVIGPNAYTYNKNYSYYTVELFDPLDFKNFRIYSSAINSSGQINTAIKTLVYEWSGGTNTYSNPEYII